MKFETNKWNCICDGNHQQEFKWIAWEKQLCIITSIRRKAKILSWNSIAPCTHPVLIEVYCYLFIYSLLIIIAKYTPSGLVFPSVAFTITINILVQFTIDLILKLDHWTLNRSVCWLIPMNSSQNPIELNRIELKTKCVYVGVLTIDTSVL